MRFGLLNFRFATLEPQKFGRKDGKKKKTTQEFPPRWKDQKVEALSFFFQKTMAAPGPFFVGKHRGMTVSP